MLFSTFVIMNLVELFGKEGPKKKKEIKENLLVFFAIPLVKLKMTLI